MTGKGIPLENVFIRSAACRISADSRCALATFVVTLVTLCPLQCSLINHWQIYANLNFGEGENEYTRKKWNKFSGWEGVTWKILSFMPSLAPFGEYCKVSEHNCKFTYYLHSPIGSLSIHFSAWILSVFIHVDWVVIFLQFFAFFPLNFSV